MLHGCATPTQGESVRASMSGACNQQVVQTAAMMILPLAYLIQHDSAVGCHMFTVLARHVIAVPQIIKLFHCFVQLAALETLPYVFEPLYFLESHTNNRSGYRRQ